MRHPTASVVACLVVVAAWLQPSSAQRPQTASQRATLFEGARLIAGDGRVPIEGSAFLVENHRYVRVGSSSKISATAFSSLAGREAPPSPVMLTSRNALLARSPAVLEAAQATACSSTRSWVRGALVVRNA